MRIIVLIIAVILPLWLTCQVVPDEEVSKKLENSKAYVASEFNEDEIKAYIKERKLRVNMELGTFFGKGFNSVSYFGTFISPHISYPIGKKFTLNTGARITQTFGNQLYDGTIHDGAFGYHTANLSRSLIYVQGLYRVNDRFILSGTAYKELNHFNPHSPLNDRYQFDSKGFIMGIDYRIGENIFIHGQIEVSDGPGYYRASPFPYRGSGFGTNPFRTFDDPF